MQNLFCSFGPRPCTVRLLECAITKSLSSAKREKTRSIRNGKRDVGKGDEILGWSNRNKVTLSTRLCVRAKFGYVKKGFRHIRILNHEAAAVRYVIRMAVKLYIVNRKLPVILQG